MLFRSDGRPIAIRIFPWKAGGLLLSLSSPRDLLTGLPFSFNFNRKRLAVAVDKTSHASRGGRVRLHFVPRCMEALFLAMEPPDFRAFQAALAVL